MINSTELYLAKAFVCHDRRSFIAPEVGIGAADPKQQSTYPYFSTNSSALIFLRSGSPAANCSRDQSHQAICNSFSCTFSAKR